MAFKDLKVEELKDLLTENEIEFAEDAKKADLVALAEAELEEVSDSEDDEAEDAEGSDESEDESAEGDSGADEETVQEAPKKAAKTAKAAKSGEVSFLGETVQEAPRQNWSEKSRAMKAFLDSQRKVPIFIPKEKGESANATESVILNGYRLNIRKGEYVDVPEQVAEVLKEAFNQTAQATTGNPLNRRNQDEA